MMRELRPVLATERGIPLIIWKAKETVVKTNLPWIKFG